MWKYIGKRMLWHIGLTIAAVLAVCLLFYLLMRSGPVHYVFGE